MDRPRLVVSAKVVCYINGQLLGRVTGFTWNSNTNRKEIKGLDALDTFEIIPTSVGVSGTMNVLRVIGDGGMQQAGVIAQQPDISREKYFTILLVERSTDLPLFKADLCSCTNESWNINAKGMMTGTVSFTGIAWNNESANTRI